MIYHELDLQTLTFKPRPEIKFTIREACVLLYTGTKLHLINMKFNAENKTYEAYNCYRGEYMIIKKSAIMDIEIIKK